MWGGCNQGGGTTEHENHTVSRGRIEQAASGSDERGSQPSIEPSSSKGRCRVGIDEAETCWLVAKLGQSACDVREPLDPDTALFEQLGLVLCFVCSTHACRACFAR